MVEQDRKLFERWISRGGDPDWKSYLGRDEGGAYLLNVTKGAWAAWQAAKEQYGRVG